MHKESEHETWIVIANAHHAKIFSKDGKRLKSELALVEALEADLDTNHEKPGRTFNSTGSLRHGVEPHTDRRDVEKEQFARKIFDFVKTGEKANRFQSLMLIASPRMLEMLNKVFDKDLQKKVTQSLTKNITDLSVFEVKEYLLSKELI